MGEIKTQREMMSLAR